MAQEAPVGEKPKETPAPAAPAGSGGSGAQVPAAPGANEGNQPPAPAPAAAVPEGQTQASGAPAQGPGTTPGAQPVGGAFESNYLGTPDARAQENSEYITLAVKDRDLTEVLRFIGRQVGVNIIPDPDVKEKVTVELDRVEWRKALDVIARLSHCKIVEEGERLIRFVQPPSISMEFQEADIKVVLELLAKQAGANILIASDVKGKVSLSLREVPWQEALQAVV